MDGYKFWASRNVNFPAATFQSASLSACIIQKGSKYISNVYIPFTSTVKIKKA